MRTRRLNRYAAVALALVIGMAPSAIAGASSAAADAAQNKNKGALRTLPGSKADVNSAQPDGTTALHWAAHWNDAEAVMLLLRAGANPKVTNRYGASPLSEAVTSGSAAMIDALLKAGADAKTLTTPDGETVLM